MFKIVLKRVYRLVSMKTKNGTVVQRAGGTLTPDRSHFGP